MVKYFEDSPLLDMVNYLLNINYQHVGGGILTTENKSESMLSMVASCSFNHNNINTGQVCHGIQVSKLVLKWSSKTKNVTNVNIEH